MLDLREFQPIEGTKIGTQIYPRLHRVAASGTAPSVDPFVPMLQAHILCDTLGSRALGVK